MSYMTSVRYILTVIICDKYFDRYTIRKQRFLFTVMVFRIVKKIYNLTDIGMIEMVNTVRQIYDGNMLIVILKKIIKYQSNVFY